MMIPVNFRPAPFYNRFKVFLPALAALILLASFLGNAAENPSARYVREPATDIPITHEVDVLVVGGASAGVAAAVAAAEEGATVFLAAQRPYLGEDLCGTYRLWLKPGEEPESALAKALFAEPESSPNVWFGDSLPFTYRADLPSAPMHPDTQPPSRLTDRKASSAPSESVQYDGDVRLVLDLGQIVRPKEVVVMVYQRVGDFELDYVDVSAGLSLDQMRPAGRIDNKLKGMGGYESSAIRCRGDIDRPVRYIALDCRRVEGTSRLLLGEIVVADSKPQQPQKKQRTPPSPMQVKRVLDQALIDAGVEFLYGCYAVDTLQEADGRVVGVTLVNRSGRQAILAKTILDVTPRAMVAELAGLPFKDAPAASQPFRRIVVGGTPQSGEGLSVQPLPTAAVGGNGSSHPAYEYTLTLPLSDSAYPTLARCEQVARDLTWSPEQLSASEILFQIPVDRLESNVEANGKSIWVLGPRGDLPADQAEALMRPLAYLEEGRKLGRRLARKARDSKDIAVPSRLKSRMEGPVVFLPGESRDIQTFVRPESLGSQSVLAPEGPIPVWGEYDVVVVGGGTGGAPAGISAARAGAKTLVIEYLNELGGVGTAGLISSYYHGYRKGFTTEIDEGVVALEGKGRKPSGSWPPAIKSEWYRQALRKAGADIWYRAMGCGAYVVGNQVKGVVVATPQGRCVVLAKSVIDSTGASAIAAAAGAECVYTDASHIAIQGTGLPPREMGAGYTNTDYTFVDDSDVYDSWRAFVVGRVKFANQYDLGQLIDTRERRQIVGDYFLTPVDIYTARTFQDTINIGQSNFDSHGFTIDPTFLLRPPDRASLTAHVPYRCLLPKGLDGILVTGLGVSAHRDAMPVIRMQPDIQNQGYAAGLAAAMAAQSGKTVRAIDIKELQGKLVTKGIIPTEAVRDEDAPLPGDAAIARAVGELTTRPEALPVMMTNPEAALPHLRAAYAETTSPAAKLMIAQALGLFGDATGAETLAASIRSAEEWDKGWKYTGMGQFGPSMSPVDSQIVALAKSGRKDAETLDLLLHKARQLDATQAFSHHRAVSIALGDIADPQAAPVLAELLSKPAMQGHAVTDIQRFIEITPASHVDTTTREASLRELVIARALYRCGDHQGLAEKILRQYAKDLRGHYARHAQAILNESRQEIVQP